MGSSGFQGVEGSLIVSFIAFTIVFIVLAGLTGVIYAIKLFAGDDEKKDSNTPSAGTPAKAAPAAAVSAPTAPSDKGRVAAVVTAAILAATQGRGRILSIVQEGLPSRGFLAEATRTWRSVGIVERVSGRLARSWKN